MSETAKKNWLQQGLQTLYEQQRHCDVTLIVQNEEFLCHKAVLAAAAAYFDTMFGSSMVEASMERLTLSDVSAPIFKDIMQFIYYNNDVITPENVEQLLHAANLFQIPMLKAKCADYMVVLLSTDNCVGLWATGVAYICEELEQASLQYILDNFNHVRKSDELLRLGKEEFINIIKHNDLNALSEDHVCKTALNWINYDHITRRQFFPDILQELRLCQVSLEFLLDELLSNKDANVTESCTRMIKDAIIYHALPERRHTKDSLETRPRKNAACVTLTLVLGRRQSLTDPNGTSTECIGYSSLDQTWYSLLQMPVDLGDEFATCPYGNDIYVSGGASAPTALFYFSSKQCRWIARASMTNGRYRHSMVAVKDSLLVLGGYSYGTVPSVEEYDISTGSWETIGTLVHAVDAATASVHKEKIFVFGGWRAFTGETADIQCFDTSTNTCSIVGQLPSPQRHLKTINHNGNTFLVFANGAIHSFKPDAKLKLVHTLQNFERKNFGLVKDRNGMYLLGGSSVYEDTYSRDDFEQLYSSVEYVPSDDDHAKILPKQLPVSMEVYGCFRTVISQKYPLVEYSEVLEYNS